MRRFEDDRRVARRGRYRDHAPLPGRVGRPCSKAEGVDRRETGILLALDGEAATATVPSLSGGIPGKTG